VVRPERKTSVMHLRIASFAVALTLAAASGSSGPVAAVQPIVLRSGSFQPGGRIPLHYASVVCSGDNFSPSLRWSGLPELTRSLMITVRDPQGRGGAGLWHWIVYDIPTSASGLASSADGKALPRGAVTATNGHGLRGYSGPCPPAGQMHDYTFTVYALDESFVQEKASVRPRDLLSAISSHVLATGNLIGTYGR
jgi:hypothetical protein